jgi:hypothetical protein
MNKWEGVVLSIHMTSNRPRELVQFLDRLEEKTDYPRAVEVVIKIDDSDREMNMLVAQEQARRPFRITYISTPLDGGFFGLWKWYDRLLELTDPSAYFVVSLNDEMYFVEKGWDTRLRKYVGLHPDGIYRLRISKHRERNTFDYWEACCAGELTPIITKKWLDLQGGWCPCNGPDSFQNSVGFYFGWLYRHDTFNRPYREHVVHDLEFGAQGSNLDLTDKSALLRRTRGAIAAWFKLMSYPMQQEAARRAQLLHAHIWKANLGSRDCEIEDDMRKKTMSVIESSSRKRVWSASYRLSRTRIEWTNFIRKFWYAYYGGAGERYRRLTPEIMRYYFCVRYDPSLTELPDLGYSRTANFVRDSLLYRYLVALWRIGLVLTLRRRP